VAPCAVCTFVSSAGGIWGGEGCGWGGDFSFKHMSTQEHKSTGLSRANTDDARIRTMIIDHRWVGVAARGRGPRCVRSLDDTVHAVLPVFEVYVRPRSPSVPSVDRRREVPSRVSRGNTEPRGVDIEYNNVVFLSPKTSARILPHLSMRVSPPLRIINFSPFLDSEHPIN